MAYACGAQWPTSVWIKDGYLLFWPSNMQEKQNQRRNKHTYPEYIVDKKPTEEDTSCAYIVEMQKLNTIESKCQSKQIVCNPMLQYNRKALKERHAWSYHLHEIEIFITVHFI